MTGNREYAYGIGDGTAHTGEALKYRGCHNGHIRTTTADREPGESSETAVFENRLENEGNNK